MEVCRSQRDRRGVFDLDKEVRRRRDDPVKGGSVGESVPMTVSEIQSERFLEYIT